VLNTEDRTLTNVCVCVCMYMCRSGKKQTSAFQTWYNISINAQNKFNYLGDKAAHINGQSCKYNLFVHDHQIKTCKSI
jgi:uncharacterized protein YfcZ (UPF0381/DUF406 family)